ncbi:hypothetical protein PFISCL1PPCAC_14907 [Pristionchus fissidentatus]|uniref:RING-type E3 ubiquitin transferase (cysteine targeting) n=1 Tax=Pristionchus fissidentatus TaxID=1538716 RepID=A0AAV5VZZ8_9BILA|nr:hypothetical protein PFISCL1PPCAC_14907 [Pristionchus fissidentatus]
METLRVVQLDAHTLNDELSNIMKASWQEVIVSLPPRFQSILDRLNDEIHLIIDMVLWSSMISRNSTSGQAFLDISYGPSISREKRISHFTLSLLLPYLSRRLPTVVGDRSKGGQLLKRVSLLFEILSLFHYLHFIRSGGYSNLSERLTSLRTKYDHPPTIGSINMDEQNRELLWNLFRDGLLLVSPLGAFLYRTYQRWGRVRGEESEGDTVGCRVCGCDNGVIPVEMNPCKCIACYWCVESAENGLCVVCEGKYEETRVVRGKKINLSVRPFQYLSLLLPWQKRQPCREET